MSVLETIEQYVLILCTISKIYIVLKEAKCNVYLLLFFFLKIIMVYVETILE